MQETLGYIMQSALLVLVIAVIVAVIQVILILVDVRQVTKKARKIITGINFLEYIVDSDDFKHIARKMRKAIFSLLEFIASSISRLLGGGEKK